MALSKTGSERPKRRMPVHPLVHAALSARRAQSTRKRPAGGLPWCDTAWSKARPSVPQAERAKKKCDEDTAVQSEASCSTIQVYTVTHDQTQMFAVAFQDEPAEIFQSHASLWQEIAGSGKIARSESQELGTATHGWPVWVLSELCEHCHFQVAEVQSGPFCGFIAIGVGLNREKMKRSSNLALAVTALCSKLAPKTLSPELWQLWRRVRHVQETSRQPRKTQPAASSRRAPMHAVKEQYKEMLSCARREVILAGQVGEQQDRSETRAPSRDNSYKEMLSCVRREAQYAPASTRSRRRHR